MGQSTTDRAGSWCTPSPTLVLLSESTIVKEEALAGRLIADFANMVEGLSTQLWS